uniref:Uncharacterized protein n=1 Tax=Nicotiana tabacum TaxID=4097 RepID=A0A1S4D6H7_TOBAC|nr:PREDICTED: uncharacterized protein LOC107826561 [Nicotiana tabacum]
MGASQGKDEMFGDLFAGVEEDDDLDALVALEEAFSKLRAELTHREEEFEKLSTELKELKTLYARREEELNSLRASPEKMLQERADFTGQIERKNALAEQLQEEISAKDAEILELKRCKDSTTLERNTLRGELAST